MITDIYKEIASAYKGEVITMPSMTEDSHILSLEQLVKDYSRGIVHNECYRQAYYDDGDDMTPITDYEDMTDIYRPESGGLNNEESHSTADPAERSAESDKGSDQAGLSESANAEAVE